MKIYEGNAVRQTASQFEETHPKTPCNPLSLFVSSSPAVSPSLTSEYPEHCRCGNDRWRKFEAALGDLGFLNARHT